MGSSCVEGAICDSDRGMRNGNVQRKFIARRYRFRFKAAAIDAEEKEEEEEEEEDVNDFSRFFWRKKAMD